MVRHVDSFGTSHYWFVIETAVGVLLLSYLLIVLMFFEIVIEGLSVQLFGRFYCQYPFKNKLIFYLLLSLHSLSLRL